MIYCADRDRDRVANYLGKIPVEKHERKEILRIFEELCKEIAEQDSCIDAYIKKVEFLENRVKDLEDVIKSGGKFEQFQSLMQSVYYDKIQKIKQIIEDDSEYPDYWDDGD